MQNMQRVLNIFVSSEKNVQQPVLQTLSVTQSRQAKSGNLPLLKIIQAARNTEAMNQDYYDFG